MSVLNNNRRELFAQLLFQGYSAVKAYEKAGYRRHDGNASTLSRHPEVLARLDEIRGNPGQLEDGAGADFPVGTRAIAARAKVTPESLIDEAEEIRAAAYKSGQYSPAVAALREKAVLSGHRIERSEVGGPGEFDTLSDDELECALLERLSALGLTVVR